MGRCALCGASELNLKSHLTETHKVKNRRELGLVLSLSRAHFKGPLRCDLCDREALSHLDRHLATVHSLRRAEITQHVKAAKEARLLGLLAELRSSQPRPPLVSELDLRRPPAVSRQPSPAATRTANTDPPTDSDTPVEVPPPEGRKPRRHPAHTPSHDSQLSGSDASVEAVTEKWQRVTVSQRLRRSPVFAAVSDFKEFNTTRHASAKDVENSGLRKSHVLRFVKYMFSRSESPSWENCTFLYNAANLRGWQAHLVQQGYTVTSINIMLSNAAAFVRHLKAFHSEMARLTPSEYDQIGLQFKRLRRDNGRQIRSHQQDVRRKKSSEFIHPMEGPDLQRSQRGILTHISPVSELLRPGTDLAVFLRVARDKVPRLLAKLQTRSGRRTTLHLLHGYMSGYLAIISGHRPIVFINLRKSHLDQADVDEQKRALVWVDRHKTDRTYGGACLALDSQEVAWLHRLYEVSAQPGGDPCDSVFQVCGKPVSHMTGQLQSAWEDAHLTGRVTFRIIRTTIANQAKRNLNAGDRQLVCESMCHGVSTADRFYTAVPGISDMFRIRQLRTNAMDNRMEPETVDTDSGDQHTSRP
ncbi:hypothetical protein SRHO_G00178770 [Serrasalmus rhombeus]